MDKSKWKSKTLWGILALAIPGAGPAISAALLAMPSTEEGEVAVPAADGILGQIIPVLQWFSTLPPVTQGIMILGIVAWTWAGKTNPDWLKNAISKLPIRG